MRGLTAAEYALLVDCVGDDPDPDVDTNVMTEAEAALSLQLVARGLLVEDAVECDEYWAIVCNVTAAGRLALRIHDALAAMEVA
jgi:hypothetical protein